MVNLSKLVVFLLLLSCNQPQSAIEKDYIRNLEQKNKILESELSKLKDSIAAINLTSATTVEDHKSLNYFTLGASEDEVVRVMGDPTAFVDLGSYGKRFNYGVSVVIFKNGKVNSFDNLGDNLKVRLKRKE